MGGQSIESWVAKNCSDLQPVLDTAQKAIAQGNLTEQWQCPTCPVKVAARRRRISDQPGMQLVYGERCANIPPIDQELK